MARKVKLSRTNWFRQQSKELMQDYVRGVPPRNVFWEEYIKIRYKEYCDGL